MTKSDLMRKMHRDGLRLDDAALAAHVAIQAHQSERNRLIESARVAGLPFRSIAAIFGLSHVHIIRVVRQAVGDVPTA